MKKAVILILISLLTYACNKVKKETVEKKAEVLNIKEPSYCSDIGQTIGILVIDKENFTGNDELKILEKDFSIFKTFGLSDEKEISSYKCLAVNDSIYSVLINNEVKYISKNDRLLSLQSWEEHLLNNIFGIGFDVEENPIRESIEGKLILDEKSNNHRISLIEIKGYWMKVKYEDYNKEKVTEGWIKWRNEKCLFIEIFYFA